MKKQYLTNEARLSAIEEIEKLINRLGNVKAADLDYISYREIVQYLCNYKEVIKEEMEKHK